VQGICNLSQDFGPAMLLARCFAEPGCFEQTAQLSCQDRRLGGQVIIKEFFLGIMQKRYRADDFIEDHQGHGHERAGFKRLQYG
jgi:hypothetical protein